MIRTIFGTCQLADPGDLCGGSWVLTMVEVGMLTLAPDHTSIKKIISVDIHLEINGGRFHYTLSTQLSHRVQALGCSGNHFTSRTGTVVAGIGPSVHLVVQIKSPVSIWFAKFFARKLAPLVLIFAAGTCFARRLARLVLIFAAGTCFARMFSDLVCAR